MKSKYREEVLDHGYVVLRNISGPVRRADQDFDADDVDPANSARFSFDGAFEEGRERSQDLKLDEYLLKNGHNTPWEMIVVWMEMKMPLFVARQFVRHRTCLSGDTKLIFESPCDGKAYPYRLSKYFKNWKDPSQKEKIRKMKLRCLDFEGGITTTQVTDVWESGSKECFRIILEDGRSIVASLDHKFLSAGDYVPLRDLHINDYLVVGKLKGTTAPQIYPTYTEKELSSECWVEFLDGYEVSNIGRIKSWYSQGSRSKNKISRIKLPTLTSQKTCVVSAGGKVYGVGRLVAENFIGSREGFHVLHKDDNVLNNRLCNLYLGLDKENREDSRRNGSLSTLKSVESKIVSISSVGVIPTYDISVLSEEHNFMANDIVTHNCSINEVSARYTQLPNEFYIPKPSLVGNSSSQNKQGRVIGDSNFAATHFCDRLDEHCASSYFKYDNAIKGGIPNELARCFLPVNIYTKWLWKMDLHNFFHFLGLRLHCHAQYEARCYAQAVYDILKEVLPHSMKMFDSYRRKPE